MIPNFSATLTVLSAMITPVVLILATGQLILTTSQRLARCIDRARKLSDQFEELTREAPKTKLYEEKKKLLYELLYRAAGRSRKLQQAMSMLYVALSILVATSVSIGLLEVFHLLVVWVPVALCMVGVFFLFYATILLIIETRLALGSVDREMNYLITNYRQDTSANQTEQP